MIIHLDMDAFYASVEEREHPELVGLPVVVGGPSKTRGVVAAANYEARKFGVVSAMPMMQASRLCPELQILPVNMPLYVSVSKQIHEIFNRYTPEIEPLSLDEAFLDVSGSIKLFGSAEEIARRIKQEIKDELRLVVSAGIAPNKFVAKIASDFDKPDGFVVVEEDAMQDFLDPLPVKRIWGVGKKTELQLNNYGITTIKDLRNQSVRWLIDRFGKQGDHIYRLAHGLDKREVISDAKAKSISAENTFIENISDKEILIAYLSLLTEQVAARLREKNRKGKTVTVKVRFHDFTTIVRSKTLAESTNQTQQIWLLVKSLFTAAVASNASGRPVVRLLGVGVSGFNNDTTYQGDLFSEGSKHDELDGVADEINQRFGKLKIHRGRNTK
ncbi:MAG: DNA polymerase IV [Gammaproteobacteria bacterium]|nr:DNA polymerase IV [Gammaproteobacteria bacterium]MCW8986728.1 DNA polymerase IV [Gammaproteobacteria bacterium]